MSRKKGQTSGGQHRGTIDGKLKVYCWCQCEMVKVDPDKVRRGKTGSCGRSHCKER